jgi:hypothetical protein
MASNEHKNLSDVNRHNPLGFEPATNNTVLSKDIGTGATETDGSLLWKGVSSMGVTNYKVQGFVEIALTNYVYGEDIKDTKSPFEMAVDYGSDEVSTGTITPSNAFRIGQGIVIPETASVAAIYGWVTSNGGNAVTIAVCRVTPVAGVTTALVPIVIAEVAVTGLSNNSKLIKIDDIDALSTTSLSAGDIIFPMIKEAVGGSDIYMNINIQTTTF